MGLVELTESSFAFDRAGLRACVEMCEFCQMGRNPENWVVYTIGERRFARFDFGFDDTVAGVCIGQIWISCFLLFCVTQLACGNCCWMNAAVLLCNMARWLS